MLWRRGWELVCRNGSVRTSLTGRPSFPSLERLCQHKTNLGTRSYKKYKISRSFCCNCLKRCRKSWYKVGHVSYTHFITCESNFSPSKITHRYINCITRIYSGYQLGMSWVHSRHQTDEVLSKFIISFSEPRYITKTCQTATKDGMGKERQFPALPNIKLDSWGKGWELVLRLCFSLVSLEEGRCGPFLLYIPEL